MHNVIEDSGEHQRILELHPAYDDVLCDALSDDFL
jgi:hypothetical protein